MERVKNGVDVFLHYYGPEAQAGSTA